jgi:hypothetical protein
LKLVSPRDYFFWSLKLARQELPPPKRAFLSHSNYKEMENFEKSTYKMYDAEKLLAIWKNQLEAEMPYPSDITRMMVHELSAEVKRNKRNAKKQAKTIEIKPQPLPSAPPSAESSLIGDCGTVIFIGAVVILVLSGANQEIYTKEHQKSIESSTLTGELMLENGNSIPIELPKNSNDSRPKHKSIFS